MAIIPSALYPAQVDADPAYPHGKARNAGSYQDGTGTPLEQKWLNDDWGFKQALLAAAAIAPSGTPDAVGASQYLDAIRTLGALRYAHYSILASPAPKLNERFQFEDNPGSPNVENGFALSADSVVLPRAGVYLAIVNGNFRTNASAADDTIGIQLAGQPGQIPTLQGAAFGIRPSADTADSVNLTIVSVGRLAHNPGVDLYSLRDKIALISKTPGSSVITTTISGGSLFLLALG